MKKLSSLIFSTLLMLSPLLANTISCGSFTISNPKIVFLNGAEVGAAYFTIVQTALTSDKLIGARIKNTVKEKDTSLFDVFVGLFSKTQDQQPLIELHDHIPALNNPDVMTMKPIKGGVEIPAANKGKNDEIVWGKPVRFETGGKHLMLYHFPEIIRKSKDTEIILTFEKAGDVSVSFPINPPSLEKEKPCPCHQKTSS